MRIIAHRGCWSKEDEKNTVYSFAKAFNNYYGIETDVRDYMGELVISHNIAENNACKFDYVLQLYNGLNKEFPLAINIKSDGIKDKLEELLLKNNINFDNVFVFDMSIPEQVIYAKSKINFFSRMSEIEKEPVQYESATGIWMDEWEESWINKDIILSCLNDGKKVSIISPEIHGRDYLPLWNIIKDISDDDNLMLCTDIPDKAKEYFYGKD